jgi:CxxC motif-containing protein (DUF1111 family)
MAYAVYSDSLGSAKELEIAVDDFLADPAEETLQQARDAYKAARKPYQQCYTAGSHKNSPELSNQVIFPYTGMLLHDMGEALADFDIDNKPVDGDIPVEFLVTATQWRTTPLWGVGLTHAVDSDATFLHDGRARMLMEAILWHDGEAQTSKDAVLKLNARERALLIGFLNDL